MAVGETGDLVSVEWLAKHIGAPDLRILDASWYLPAEGRDPKAEYEAEHIPGARFFDIEEISDSASDLPHMAPPVEKFISRMRAMGIGDGHRVVVYDSSGLFSAARVWWMFRLMGKMDISVLDGGLPAWKAAGHDVDDEPPLLRDRHFTARRDGSKVRDVTQVAAQVKLGQEQIVDARSPARFRGDEPEARAGLRAGHIPGSLNVYYKDVLTADGHIKSEDELRAVFTAAGVDADKPIITTCGSGVTAAILSLALSVIGHRQVALYDGSWAEWGMYPDLKVSQG
ncbi:thiosulfate/3-mercaptopyruvate sulfurtransferase [Monaibacterium marinum]|uniref:Sulfurtransferase n=1 Tax=Pontivivens marinum TaxID=1690039 RepID=A0A2C9CXW5_9RHOB|nr:3-mercaptopyruvate sulfurtransferase [Monaibacterium marinum]SOH95289.1 thiosulfate/3-mercaptopyruvate sulfurtransferase [Monaibacterium marinum]